MATNKINFAQMSKAEYSAFMNEVKETLNKLGAGRFTVSSGSGRYAPDGSNLTVKLEFAVVNNDGTSETKEHKDFMRYHEMYGFKKEDLGRSFMFKGERRTIVGLAMSRRKYPVLCKCEDGTQKLHVVSDVHKLLALPSASK